MMTSTTRASRLALLGIVLALVLAAALLAACGGDSPDASGERAVTPRPETAESGDPGPTSQGILGIGSQSAAGPDATDEPQPAAAGRLLLPFGQTSAATDREALVVLYNATDGPNWDDDENWLSDAPLDEWKGVATSDDGRVTELDLSENRLSGEIPPELGRLASLTVLSLYGNELSGEIPPELGRLASLTVLSLYGNELSGEIPPELGNLASLVLLSLYGNELSGKIPPELGNLASLTELWLKQQPVERGDTAGTGRPRQPGIAVAPQQPVERMRPGQFEPRGPESAPAAFRSRLLPVEAALSVC